MKIKNSFSAIMLAFFATFIFACNQNTPEETDGLLPTSRVRDFLYVSALSEVDSLIIEVAMDPMYHRFTQASNDLVDYMSAWAVPRSINSFEDLKQHTDSMSRAVADSASFIKSLESDTDFVTRMEHIGALRDSLRSKYPEIFIPLEYKGVSSKDMILGVRDTYRKYNPNYVRANYEKMSHIRDSLNALIQN